MKLEPIAVINSLIALVEATVALAVGFGLNWDGKQVGLVMALVVALGNVVKTIWARGQVTPVADPRNNQGQPLVPTSRQALNTRNAASQIQGEALPSR